MELLHVTLSDIEDKLRLLPDLEERIKGVTSRAGNSLSQAFIEAAAVLVFFDPDLLNPLAGDSISIEDKKSMLVSVIGSSEMVLSGNEEDRPIKNDSRKYSKAEQRISYYLKDAVRKKILKTLKDEKRIQAALDANPDQAFNRTDLLQRTFTDCLLGVPQDLSKMNIKELNAVQRVSEWFEDNGIPLLSKSNIEKRIATTEMLTAFRHLTGKYEDGKFIEQFRGRKNELSELRKYVGVVPPQSSLESLHRSFNEYVESVFNWNKKPPMLIFGLGGVGKSTLLAKFILDHVDAQEADRFPFVYLDFDRPSLSPFELETLLIEIARQLAIQYSDDENISKRFTSFYIQWKDWEFSSSEDKSTRSIYILSEETSRNVKDDRDAIFSDFIDTISIISREPAKPFLLVIDTFEEVQYKGQECVKQLYDFMLRIQNSYPLLRVVVAGRAPVTQIKTQEMELGNLDVEASIAFLERFGIADKTTAQSIIKKVGGNPLTLKLAAELAKNYGTAEINELNFSTRKLFVFEKQLPQIQIQGILYRRILRHIHDPRVLKLAHPGLTLREITPELILKVLAGPCELDIHTMEEAEFLFSEMSKEVSLITPLNAFTIRHRPDVRKVMLTLIEDEKPRVVEEIHWKAVEYYGTKEGISARAEEMYHRLCLNESPRELDSRWVEGIQDYLLGSMDEFPARARAFLSGRTGVEFGDPVVWDQADDEDLERSLVRKAANLLNVGNGDEVLEMLSSSQKQLSRRGIFTLLKVRALMLVNRKTEAMFEANQELNSYYSAELNPQVRNQLIKCIEKIKEDEGQDNVPESRDLDIKKHRPNRNSGRNGPGEGSFDYNF